MPSFTVRRHGGYCETDGGDLVAMALQTQWQDVSMLCYGEFKALESRRGVSTTNNMTGNKDFNTDIVRSMLVKDLKDRGLWWHSSYIHFLLVNS